MGHSARCKRASGVGHSARSRRTVTLSSWVSVETGEDQTERVERVVPEQAMESHEEFAEAFFLLSGAVFAVAAAGMLNGRIGRSSRVVATLGAVGLAGAGIRVGQSGGQLVYTTVPPAPTHNRAQRRPQRFVAIAGRNGWSQAERCASHNALRIQSRSAAKTYSRPADCRVTPRERGTIPADFPHSRSRNRWPPRLRLRLPEDAIAPRRPVDQQSDAFLGRYRPAR